MWNLKNKNKLIDLENKLVVARGWGWRCEKWVKDVKKKIITGESFWCQTGHSISLSYPQKSQKEHRNVPACSKIIFLAFILAL